MAILSYTNRHGDTYYLHTGKTKTGKPRYFVAKKAGKGALAAMPDGWELTESINAVVSVRRVKVGAPAVPEADLAVARGELARHRHLQFHRAEAVKGDIVVFERGGSLAFNDIETMAKNLGVPVEVLQLRLSGNDRYVPVMKLVPDDAGGYAVQRMTYRGAGGWSWPIAHGPLAEVVRKFLGLIGTDRFFELM